MPSPIVVRAAVAADLREVAALAASLVRMHHEVDPHRFFLAPNLEEGYASWLSRELRRDAALVLVASSEGDGVVGYAYGTLEERDWNLLLDRHGAIHDLFVAQAFRRRGVGRQLVDAMAAALAERGAPRLVLATMVGNEAAQRLFRACGFRPTMLEMTR